MLEAHFKMLRCYRKWCRSIPMIISWYGLRKYTTPEEAKLQLGKHFRHFDRARNPRTIDDAVVKWYERLYTIHQGDVWGGYLLDYIHPVGKANIEGNQGFSVLREEKYKTKTDFLSSFYHNDEGKVPY